MEKSAKVYVVGRSQSKFNDCVSRLEPITPNKPLFISCDLASMTSTNAAGKHLHSLEAQIHVLFCSAGIAWSASGAKSEDGYELTFHVNVMSHYILFQWLEPALKSAGNIKELRGRVVWLTSYGLNTAPKGGVNFESLKVDEKGLVGKGLRRQPLYGQVCSVFTRL